MEEGTGNSVIVLLKTNTRIKELVSQLEVLRIENIHLREDLKQQELRTNEDTNDWQQRCDELTSKCSILEKELNSSSIAHEQELGSIQNEQIYLSNELLALQHMCEAKIVENEKVHKEMENLRYTSNIPTQGGCDDDKALHQQIEYIDKKLQSTLRRVLDIQKESEIIEHQNKSYQTINTILQQEIMYLLQLLTTCISRIHSLTLQLRAKDREIEKLRIEPLLNQQKIVEEEKSQFDVEEDKTDEIFVEKLECYEQLVKELQLQVDRQKDEIILLQEKQQNENNKQPEPFQIPTHSFDNAIKMLQENQTTRISLLEEENSLLKQEIERHNQESYKQTTTPELLNLSVAIESTSVGNKRVSLMIPPSSKKPDVSNDTNLIHNPTLSTSVPSHDEEKCRVCNDGAYGFMISCCKCHHSYHISCVISKNENVSELLRKSKQFICTYCK